MQVLRKFRSYSVHVASLDTAGIFNVENDSILRANVTRDKGSPCLGAVGASVWGVGLAGCRFLCAGKYLALLIEHEWSGPQHSAHGGVTFPGIMFMTWRAQGDKLFVVGFLVNPSTLSSGY